MRRKPLTKKDKWFQIRTTKQEHDIIKDYCNRTDVTISQLVIDSLPWRKILEEHIKDEDNTEKS